VITGDLMPPPVGRLHLLFQVFDEHSAVGTLLEEVVLFCSQLLLGENTIAVLFSVVVVGELGGL